MGKGHLCNELPCKVLDLIHPYPSDAFWHRLEKGFRLPPPRFHPHRSGSSVPHLVLECPPIRAPHPNRLRPWTESWQSAVQPPKMVGQRWKTPNSPLETHLLIMFMFIYCLYIFYTFLGFMMLAFMEGTSWSNMSWWSCDWNWPHHLTNANRPALTVTFTHARHHDHALLDKVVKNHAIWTFAVKEFINVPGWHTHLCIYIILYTHVYIYIYICVHYT